MPAPDTLASDKPPTLGLMVKWLALCLLLAAVTVVVVGLLLPREWKVERSVEITGDMAEIHAVVEDAEQWDRWMFDPDADTSLLTVEAKGRGEGAWIRWTGDGSRGEIAVVESAPTGIRWDGKIEAEEVNNHGQIRYEPLADGVVRVTLTDTGTLPPVFGGFFVPVMNSALDQHFAAALTRLEALIEGVP